MNPTRNPWGWKESVIWIIIDTAVIVLALVWLFVCEHDWKAAAGVSFFVGCWISNLTIHISWVKKGYKFEREISFNQGRLAEINERIAVKEREILVTETEIAKLQSQ